MDIRASEISDILKAQIKNFGAVLFPGAQFKFDDKPTTFVVDAVKLPNGSEIIAKACEAAHKEG